MNLADTVADNFTVQRLATLRVLLQAVETLAPVPYQILF